MWGELHRSLSRGTRLGHRLVALAPLVAPLVALVIALVIALAWPAAASADGRVALIIGNSGYDGEIGRLKNPANDATLMSETLKGLGFSVELVLDADQKAMKRAVKSFGAKLREAGPQGIGLFYYAGHGVQVGGENFLIPVGAEIQAEGDVEIEAISAGSILSQMQYAGNGVNLVFLDACRNNPLTRSFRSAERGLARVEAPTGSFVGYSTAPGEVAADGDGANSPYALALVEELQRPGISVDAAHRNVRAKVLAATGKRQTPWDSSSLTGEVVLASQGPAAAAQQPPAQPSSNQAAELLFWESIKDSNNAALYEAYLKQYPGGIFAAIATAKIAELTPALAPATTEVAAVTPEPAPAPAPPIEIDAMDETYVAKQAANVRAEPSTESPAIGRLAADDGVAVTGRVKGKDWLRVALDGETGYVSAKLLAEADADEIAAWKALNRAPEKDAIAAFLDSYPGSYFKPRAEQLLAALDQAAAPPPTPASAAPIPSGSDVQAAWNKISAAGTQQDFEAFLRQYPDGAFAALARDRLNGMLMQADFEAWYKASGAGTAAAYRDYLQSRPNGAFAAEARKRLADPGGSATTQANAAPTGFGISRGVANSIEDYFRDIDRTNVGAFAVSEDGSSSYYVYCDRVTGCAGYSFKAEAVKECRQRSGQDCFVLLYNGDKARDYYVR